MNYADGMVIINFVKNMVHFDFGTLQLEENGECSILSKFHIVMSPQGVLNFYNMAKGLIDQLEECGVLSKSKLQYTDDNKGISNLADKSHISFDTGGKIADAELVKKDLIK